MEHFDRKEYTLAFDHFPAAAELGHIDRQVFPPEIYMAEVHFFLLGIAVEHFCLQAVEEGLGTCIMGWFDETGVKRLLEVPRGKRVHLTVAVGYAASEVVRPKARKDRGDILAFNGYAAEELDGRMLPVTLFPAQKQCVLSRATSKKANHYEIQPLTCRVRPAVHGHLLPCRKLAPMAGAALRRRQP